MQVLQVALIPLHADEPQVLELRDVAGEDQGGLPRAHAGAVQADVAGIRSALVRQLYLPVRWTQCVQALAAAGATRIGECGPGKVLTGLIKRIDKQLDGRALGAPADLAQAMTDWSAA